MVFSITKERENDVLKRKQQKEVQVEVEQIAQNEGIIFQNKLNKNNFSHILLHCLVFRNNFFLFP